MRLLIIGENFHAGVGVHVRHLVEAALAQGDTVHVVYVRGKLGEPDIEFRHFPGLIYEQLGTGTEPISALEVLRKVRSISPDVILCPKGGVSNGRLWFDVAARFLAPEVITVEHSMPPTPPVPGRPYLGLIPRLSLWWRWSSFRMKVRAHLPTRIVAVSGRLGSALISSGYPSDKVKVVPNGVDVEQHRRDASQRETFRKQWGLKDNAVVFGTVGRVSFEEKRQDLLLDSFCRLREHPGLPPVYLAVVGDGPDMATLRRRVAERGVGDQVLLLGWASYPVKELSALDAYVLTSVAEGFCYSLVEAMACELPCIATRVGVAEEALSDGVAGWLIDVDDETALVKAMLEVATLSPEQRKSMGQSARNTAEAKFSGSVQAGLMRQVLASASS